MNWILDKYWYEKFENTKVVIRSHKMNDRQYNGQKTNNDPQTLHGKQKINTNPTKKGGLT